MQKRKKIIYLVVNGNVLKYLLKVLFKDSRWNILINSGNWLRSRSPRLRLTISLRQQLMTAPIFLLFILVTKNCQITSTISFLNPVSVNTLNNLKKQIFLKNQRKMKKELGGKRECRIYLEYLMTKRLSIICG